MWCDFCIASAVKDVTPLCVGLPPSRSAERRALHLSAGAGNVLSNVFSRGYSRCVTHGPGVLWSGSRYGRLHKHISVSCFKCFRPKKKSVLSLFNSHLDFITFVVMLTFCVFNLVCSWCPCGTVSCAVSIAALCEWSGQISHWSPLHVSTSRCCAAFSNAYFEVASLFFAWLKCIKMKYVLHCHQKIEPHPIHANALS